MRARTILAIGAASLLGTSLIAAPASGSSSQLAGVRQATAALHSLPAAETAGYEEFLPCFDAPGVGGMGQHYANFSLIDGVVDATHPEVLVYEPHRGGMKLVAAEYVVPQSAWTAAEPPELFGEHFHRNDTLGIWALHAWIWRPNFAGMHADYNPRVTLCG